ncbi:trimeric intracellular cation channel family protein [Georgenia thermotolerans]|uniref:Trimeric intracellular cation channel family protein n=1 Tax=Georgenia thermotolerans TaxID=527326 RepID=A0A7J5UU96_9MICO|nr:trimeric intracellular cation channel family protein [Georgenia thermotolerans]
MHVAEVARALDLLGVFAFAVNGAFTAVEKTRVDIVGILSLGIITALGGGIIRDLCIGSVPPAAFTDRYYLGIAAGGALLAFFVSRLPRLLQRPMLVLDAIGLSVFAVSGAQKALAFGLSPAPAILLGAVTAVGGGTIRDVLIREVPSVLSSGLYAIPAIIGATITVLTVAYDPRLAVWGAVVGAVVCFVIRMLGLRYNVDAPTGLRRGERHG